MSKEKFSRKTIAFFLDYLTDEYEVEIWNGVMDKAQELDINLFCVTAHEIHSKNEVPDLGNVLYDLTNNEKIDGMIFLTAALANEITSEQMKEFLTRYGDKPIVSVGQKVEGIPTILVENKTCMTDAISHLIEVHDYKKIAFIGGPDNNPEAIDRLNGYKEILKKFNIEYDPDLVFPGEFEAESGINAVKELLLHNREFDAIACVDDVTAMGAIEELQKNKIMVPGDKAVIGFDDIEEANFLTPPLTTVRQPLFEQGQKAVEVLMRLINEEKIDEDITLNTELKIRQSCGCLDPTVKKAAVGALSVFNGTESEDKVKIDKIRSEMINTIIDSSVDSTTHRANVLLKAFIDEIKNHENNKFLVTLDLILGDVIKEGGDIFSWQEAMSVIRKHILTIVSNKSTILFVEDLLQQASVMIGEAAERAQAYRRFLAKEQAHILRELGNILVTTFELDELILLMQEELPAIDMPSCYITLYEGNKTPPETCKLIVGFNEDGKVDFTDDNCRYPANTLIPVKLLGDDDRFTSVVIPLYFSTNNIGLAVAQVGPTDGSLYQTLHSQISTALQGALLLEELKEKQRQEVARLKKEMEIAKRIQTALLPTIPEVKNFDLAAAMYPADDVGGDYYDFFVGADGRTWYVIGDVSGHGLTAGLIMLMAQSSICTALIANPEIEMKKLYSVVNMLLVENIRHRLLTDHFMTLSIIAKDNDDNFTIIGSHIDQMIYRAESNTCEYIESGGLWAGLSEAANNTVTKNDFTLNKGDILLLYTDGLIEAMNEEDEQFDVERVEKLLIEHHDKTVDEIKQIIVDEVYKFMHYQGDDITLFLVKKQ